jgi:hypothetical protein
MSKATDDEIDLLELFRRMGRTISKWFNAIGRAFLVSVIFLIKNMVILLVSLLIGIGISYIIKWTTKPFYVSEITFRSNVVPNAEMLSYINKLRYLLKQKNYSQVSAALSIKPENNQGIIDLEGFWVIDKNNDSIPDFIDYRNKHDVYDTLNVRMKDRFVIRVKVRDPGSLSSIRDGIESYANSNKIFQKKNELRLKQYDELLSRIDYDILQLDSLQKVKYFEETRNRIPEKGGQMIFLQEQNTQLVYDNIYSLYNKKQSIETEKSLYPEILSLVSDFSQPLKRFNGGFYYGKIIIPTVVGLMLLYLIFHRNRKKIREIYRAY